MRTVKEIREDIIEASKNYDTVLTVASRIMLDSDRDADGTKEVLNHLRGQLRNLYAEFAQAISAPMRGEVKLK